MSKCLRKIPKCQLSNYSKNADLLRLKMACRPILRLGLRSRSRIARELSHTLQTMNLPSSAAKRVARAVASTTHSTFLSLSEATAALSTLGISISRSSLYRMAERTQLFALNERLVVFINKKGHWGPEAEVVFPIAKIVAWYRRKSRPAFKIVKVKLK